MIVKLNFALNLPDQVRAWSIALSQEMSRRYDSHFVLGKNENHPHITVCTIDFHNGHMQRVLDAVEQLAAETNPLTCTVQRIETHQGYIGVEVIKSSTLMHFHEQAVKLMAPLRAQQHGDEANYGMTFTDEQIANMEQYGYPDAMQLYNPHFTITRLTDEPQAEKLVPSIQVCVSEFTVRSIGIYTMGDHGTCKKLFGEFMLD